MYALMPKISWHSTMPGPLPDAGSARYPLNLLPCAVLISIHCPPMCPPGCNLRFAAHEAREQLADVLPRAGSPCQTAAGRCNSCSPGEFPADYRNLEIQITPDKELHGLNGRIGIERKGDVDMQDVAECGAVVEDAQANTHIAQPTRIHRVLRWAAPRPAHIIKYCPANAEQSNGIPIGIDTFFNCEQRPVVAALVAQGIAAQAVFAPEQQDILHVGISYRIGRSGSIENRTLEVWYEVAYRAAQQLSFSMSVSVLASEAC